MKKEFRLVVDFVAEIDENFITDNSHEREFWNALIKDDNAIVEFYLWYFFEPFRECPGFKSIPDILGYREDNDIIEQVLDKLPPETAQYFRTDDQSDYIWQKIFFKIHDKFKPPEVGEVSLYGAPYAKKDLIHVLENSAAFRLDTAYIIEKGKFFRLIVLNQQREFINSFVPSLEYGKDYFIKLFGDRRPLPECEWEVPKWRLLDFTKPRSEETKYPS